MLPLLLEILLLIEKSRLSLQRSSHLLLLDLLIVLRLENGMVFFRIFEGVADQLHPQGLDFNFLYFLLLETEDLGFLESLCEVAHIFVEFPHVLANVELLLEGLVELEHIEVGHEYEVIHGGLLERLDHEVVHDDQVVEEVGGSFIEEGEGLVEFAHAVEGLEDGDESIDDVIEFEDPDEAYLAAPAEDVVVGDVALLAGMIQFLVGRQFHEVVVQRNEEFLADKAIEIFGFWLDLVMLELTGFGEDLDLFIEDDVADVELANFADLDEDHHDLELLAAAALLLQLLDDDLEEGLLRPLLASLLEAGDGPADHLGGEAVSCEIHLLEFLHNRILLEQRIHEFHLTLL
jgi:hypothetical protein